MLLNQDQITLYLAGPIFPLLLFLLKVVCPNEEIFPLLFFFPILSLKFEDGRTKNVSYGDDYSGIVSCVREGEYAFQIQLDRLKGGTVSSFDLILKSSKENIFHSIEAFQLHFYAAAQGEIYEGDSLAQRWDKKTPPVVSKEVKKLSLGWLYLVADRKVMR